MSDAGFLRACSLAPNDLAVFDGNTGEWLKRGQLAARVESFAERLRFPRKALGFLFSYNDTDSLIAYLASVHAGHAVALLNPELDEVLRARLITLFEPDFLITPSPSAPVEGYREWPSPHSSQVLLRSESAGRHAIHPDLSLLLSTSGSTGSPKLVRLTWRNLEFNAGQVIDALRLAELDRTMITAPIFNALALSAIHTLLLCGGSFALTRARVVSREFWNAARESGCNWIGGTPFFYQTLDRMDVDSLNVPLLKNFLQTGGIFPSHLARNFHEISLARGGGLHLMYGQSEAGPRMSHLGPENLPDGWRSIGFAVPRGHLWVANDGHKCAPMEEGELFYHGPNVMMGYALGPADLAKEDELRGTLATGDLGYCDARGLFYITGRKARFAKVFGWRVSLDEVEELLASAGTVAATSETDRVVIYAERPGALLFDAVDELAGRLKIHRSGFEIREVDTIPRLANNKVDYRSLAQAIHRASV